MQHDARSTHRETRGAHRLHIPLLYLYMGICPHNPMVDNRHRLVPSENNQRERLRLLSELLYSEDAIKKNVQNVVKPVILISQVVVVSESNSRE